MGVELVVELHVDGEGNFRLVVEVLEDDLVISDFGGVDVEDAFLLACFAEDDPACGALDFEVDGGPIELGDEIGASDVAGGGFDFLEEDLR